MNSIQSNHSSSRDIQPVLRSVIFLTHRAPCENVDIRFVVFVIVIFPVTVPVFVVVVDEVWDYVLQGERLKLSGEKLYI